MQKHVHHRFSMSTSTRAKTAAKAGSTRRSSSAPVPGMGAIPLRRGFAFRLWAPHAETVSVVGTFNEWDPARHVLEREAHDTWFGIVPEAEAGHEYAFVLRHDGEEIRRVDPRARRVVNSAGNGILWAPPARRPRAISLPSHDQLVIYELHIGSFNTTPGTPGTFASAAARLPYLRDLGINVVEIMPVGEFAGDFSWGYNPAHPFAVESIYGGPDGLLAFIDAAHEHGIAVILDVVYNHFGPSDLSLWQFDGWQENGMGGIYFYNDWRAATPWGDTRPDYGRGEVRSYIRDNAMMWLHDFGVDGLRWDMTVFIRSYKGNPGDPGDDLKEGWGLMQWLNNEIAREFPGAFTIAEDLRNSEWLVKGTGAGGAGFNAQWDGAFVHPVRGALITPEDEHRDLNAIVDALQARYDGDAFKRVVYSESHDEVANGKARLPTEIAADAPGDCVARKRSTLAAALVFTAPGVPMLFQGQEFLEDEWFRDHVPIDWAKLDRFHGIQQCYRDLIALRLNRAGHTAGLTGQHLHVHHVDHERKVLAFHRWRDGGAGDDVVVVLNLSHQPVSEYAIGVPTAGRWQVRLNSDSRAYSDDFSDHPGQDCEATEEPLDGKSHRIVTGIGAYAGAIFSVDQ